MSEGLLIENFIYRKLTEFIENQIRSGVIRIAHFNSALLMIE